MERCCSSGHCVEEMVAIRPCAHSAVSLMDESSDDKHSSMNSLWKGWRLNSSAAECDSVSARSPITPTAPLVTPSSLRSTPNNRSAVNIATRGYSLGDNHVGDNHVGDNHARHAFGKKNHGVDSAKLWPHSIRSASCISPLLVLEHVVDEEQDVLCIRGHELWLRGLEPLEDSRKGLKDPPPQLVVVVQNLIIPRLALLR